MTLKSGDEVSLIWAMEDRLKDESWWFADLVLTRTYAKVVPSYVFFDVELTRA